VAAARIWGRCVKVVAEHVRIVVMLKISSRLKLCSFTSGPDVGALSVMSTGDTRKILTYHLKCAK
jgi:hypothetical protein